MKSNIFYTARKIKPCFAGLFLLLPLWLSSQDSPSANPTSNPEGAAYTIPFRLVKNLIIVKARMNGVEGDFIVDTGASDVTLNERFFTGIRTGDIFNGINGSVDKHQITFGRLNLNGVEQKISAAVANFSALEKRTGLPLYGVVGNSFFRDCQVVFDYVFQELTIYKLDKKGNCTCPKVLHQTPLDTLRFSLKGNMPVVEVMAGGKRLKMGLDSGASVCILEEKHRNKLQACLSEARSDLLIGFGSEAQYVNAAQFGQLQVGKLPCEPMNTFIVSLKDLNDVLPGAALDGLMGYEFFSQFRIAINFQKKEIYVWDLPTVEAQWIAAKNKAGKLD